MGSPPAETDSRPDGVTGRPRGWIATTPEEVAAVWRDAHAAVKAERPVMRRRALRALWRLGEGE